MSDRTLIEWCDKSFSPWWGCTPVSPGCLNCYAASLAKRFRGLEYRRGVPRQKAKDWTAPRKWNREALTTHRKSRCHKCGYVGPVNSICPTPDCRTFESEMEVVRPRIFPSMCDIFDDEVPDSWRQDFFRLVYQTPNLDWLILTKRPEQHQKWVCGSGPDNFPSAWPNVWLGVSAENQEQADSRIPLLLEIPAKIRFVSVEPMLGPVHLDKWLWQMPEKICEDCPREADCECGFKTAKENGRPSIDWVIYGGESGRGARPCDVLWIRQGVVECAAANVACFVKQLGKSPIHLGGYSVSHSKGGEPSEWPADLRIRQFPIP